MSRNKRLTSLDANTTVNSYEMQMQNNSLLLIEPVEDESDLLPHINHDPKMLTQGRLPQIGRATNL